jgi:CRP-like cAMP-binding protein
MTMTETTLLQVFETVRFLDGVPEEDRRRLAAVARLEGYRPGAVIFREGERVPRIFLVIEGTVALEIRVPAHGARRIFKLEPGELLGWSPILDQLPMTATARAFSPTRLVALDAAEVLALCQDDPKFGFTFMRQTAAALAARLTATRRQLLELYRDELPVVAGIHEGAD